jgi:DNA-binding MarR family transcriptional regulator
MSTNAIAIDRESIARSSDHAVLRLWLRLLTCTTLVENQVRTSLRQSFQTTLPRFDLMSQLDRHPEGLRMNELSTRMMVTCANITGITDQLEREGLVLRTTAKGDRRSYIIKLTAQGKRQFAQMASAHGEWIRKIFSDLSATEVRHLYDLLAMVKVGAMKCSLSDQAKIVKEP